MKKCVRTYMTLLTIVAATKVPAQEPVVTLHSTVSGSQEQPRVMYIVPWQEPDAAQFDYELNNELAQEIFAPIDRDEFVRGLNYQQILGESGEGNAVSASSN